MPKNKPQFTPRKRNYMNRAVDLMEIRQRFLIVCEGEKTEPFYFKKFRAAGLVVDVKGIGMNTLSLVKEAIKLRDEDEYDQTWCVFDKDDFSEEQFEEAIKYAGRNGIKAAYSNQAFELWYVLHFEFLNSAIGRGAYIEKLDKYLGCGYRKNDPGIYQKLADKMDTAIENAKRLLDQYTLINPGKEDPSTMVHELVAELLKHGKPVYCTKD